MSSEMSLLTMSLLTISSILYLTHSKYSQNPKIVRYLVLKTCHQFIYDESVKNL